MGVVKVTFTSQVDQNDDPGTSYCRVLTTYTISNRFSFINDLSFLGQRLFEISDDFLKWP